MKVSDWWTWFVMWSISIKILQHLRRKELFRRTCREEENESAASSIYIVNYAKTKVFNHIKNTNQASLPEKWHLKIAAEGLKISQNVIPLTFRFRLFCVYYKRIFCHYVHKYHIGTHRCITTFKLKLNVSFFFFRLVHCKLLCVQFPGRRKTITLTNQKDLSWLTSEQLPSIGARLFSPRRVFFKSQPDI